MIGNFNNPTVAVKNGDAKKKATESNQLITFKKTQK